MTGVAASDLEDKVEPPAGYTTTEPDQEAYGMAPGSEIFAPADHQRPADPGRLDPSLRRDSPEPAEARHEAAPLSDAWLEKATAAAPQR